MLENQRNNVSNLSLNKVHIALADYVNRTVVIYLSIAQCVRGWSLSDSLNLDHKIRKYSFGMFYVSWVRFVSGNYLLNRNGIITF